MVETTLDLTSDMQAGGKMQEVMLQQLLKQDWEGGAKRAARPSS